MRERVLAAAAELGYRPDRTASTLARRRTRLLGVLLDVRNSYHAELAADLHEAAEQVGYDVVLSTITAARDEERAVETLVDSRCAALVLLGPSTPDAALRALGGQVPVVVVGRRVDASVDVVRSNDRAGVGQVVDHLADLGHRDIAFLDGGRGTIAADRRAGYRAAMRKRGLADSIRVVAGDPTEIAGSAAAQTLLTESQPPTAVVAFNDRAALGLLDGLVRAGTSVPEHMSVVGYDDSPAAQLPHVDLTTVSQDARGQAEHAVAMAIERLDGGRTASSQVVLPPRLVVRGSTAGPRPNVSRPTTRTSRRRAPTTRGEP